MLAISGKYFCIPIIICLWNTAKCDIKTDVKQRVIKLIERSRTIYGDTQRGPIKQWELDLEDATSYPNGDGQKLAEVSHAWIDYYRCTSHAIDSVTSSGHLPSVDVVVYEGEAARLPCGLCVAPGESDRVAWYYAESVHNATFTPLGDKPSMVFNVNVTIYKVRAHDAGLYRCRLGSSVGGLVVLQVLHDYDYRVVDADSSRPTEVDIATSPTSTLVPYISWSPWSECSACDRAGRRRRYGMCFVRLNKRTLPTTSKTSDAIFQEYPDGIYCRSWLLPTAHPNYPTIANIKNIIMHESCEIPCIKIFEVRSKSGEVLERANNSDGVFSLAQTPPPQPPPPVREVIFAEHGSRLTLECPGSTLRDIPISWRRGTERLAAGTPADRVHLNARDQIVFTSVQEDDANVFSCWQSAALAGVLELEVRPAAGRPTALVCLSALAAALHRAVGLSRSRRRHAQ